MEKEIKIHDGKITELILSCLWFMIIKNIWNQDEEKQT